MQGSSSVRPLNLRRLALGCAAVALLVDGSALAAGQSLNMSQCKRVTRQIDHFGSVAEMAKERGDRMWFNGTVAHIQRLSEHQERVCPEEEKPNYVLMMTKWFGKTARATGRSFLRYLTFGAY